MDVVTLSESSIQWPLNVMQREWFSNLSLLPVASSIRFEFLPHPLQSVQALRSSIAGYSLQWLVCTRIRNLLQPTFVGESPNLDRHPHQVRCFSRIPDQVIISMLLSSYLNWFHSEISFDQNTTTSRCSRPWEQWSWRLWVPFFSGPKLPNSGGGILLEPQNGRDPEKVVIWFLASCIPW